MALKAGYYGIKKKILNRLLGLPVDISNIRLEQALLGARNINGTKYVTGTDHSVVWTANSDGSVTAVSGTATGDNAQNGLANPFVAPFTSQVNLTGGLDSHIYLFPYDVTDNARPYTDSSKTARVSSNQYGDIPLSFYMEEGHRYSIIARVVQNYSANNNTLYPLLTVASDTDPEYVPYAMTNRELTDQLTTKSVITGIEGITAYKNGKTVMLYLALEVPSGSGYYTVGTLPEELRPGLNLVFVGYDNNVSAQGANTVIDFSVSADGSVNAYRFSDKSSYALRATITYLIP